MAENDRVVKLVRRTQRGDTQAFRSLYDLTFKRIYYSALKMFRNQQEALEATQNVYEAAYRTIGSLAEPRAFYKWINQISHNTFSNMIRSRDRMQTHTIPTELTEESGFEENYEEFIPESYVHSQEEADRITTLVDDLPRSQRETIVMYYFEQLSGEEISDITGRSPEAVYKTLSRARGTLKERLGTKRTWEMSKAGGVAASALARILAGDAERQASVEVVRHAQKQIWSSLSGSAGVGLPAALGAKGILAKGLIAACAAVTIAGVSGAVMLGGSPPAQLAVNVRLAPPQTLSIPAQEATYTVAPQEDSPSPDVPMPARSAQTVKSVPIMPAPPMSPQITVGQSELYYPAGANVSLAQILDDAHIQATDASGARLAVTASGYDSIDFETPGSYIVSIHAIDRTKTDAQTAVVAIFIQ